MTILQATSLKYVFKIFPANYYSGSILNNLDLFLQIFAELIKFRTSKLLAMHKQGSIKTLKVMYECMP